MFQNHLFHSGVEIRFGATISSADCIVMAASRLLRAVAAFVILLSFAAGSRKSYWSGGMKAATMVCQQIFSILALVIFQGKQIWPLGKI